MNATSALTILVVAALLGGESVAATPAGGDASASAPIPVPAQEGVASGDKSIPIRVESATSLTLREAGLSARMDAIILTWRLGPLCTGAGAATGIYDRVAIRESKNDLIVTLYLRNATAHPALVAAPGAKKCGAGAQTHTRIVPLDRPLGKRVVHDWACPTSCRVPPLDTDSREALLNRLY